jgi:Fe-S cluster biogenesis protein NfuA/nitrite reductase/ring-hydroxylating ferredoxin subunit
VDDREARERISRVEALLDDAEGLADPAARATALALVQAILELYGEGLTRIVDHVAAGDDGALAAAFSADELVAHLLFLHGIHPVPLEARVHDALEEVRPYLASHGGDVELLGVQDGIVRLRLQGSCSGCPSSTATLKLAIEDAIHKAAPDVERVEAEGAVEAAPPSLLQIEMAPARPQRAWSMTAGIPELDEDATLVREVEGEAVLFLRLGGRVLAYRSRCPGCETPLDAAPLSGRELSCAGCGNRYDVRRAGRGLDASTLQLEPLPLLVDHDGGLKVALGAAA